MSLIKSEMTILNTSLIVLSLKYINIKYENISNISKWIFDKLVESQYKDFKLQMTLRRMNEVKEINFEIISLLIKFDHDKKVINEFLSILFVPFMCK